MFKFNRSTLVSLLLIGAYLLSACAGAAAPQSTSPSLAPKVQAKEIVFTGVIEAMNGNEWIVSGQKVTVDASASLDPNLAVGVIVKVEGQVSADGVVTALKVETSAVTDDNANGGNVNDNDNINANTNANTNDDNSNSANDNGNAAGGETEIFGVVETITTDSITVNGVTYMLANFTEFKDAVAVGDQVKLHILVNADGTFTIREIERSDGFGDDNSNDDNGNDDNSNDDNGNDDNSNNDNGSGGNSNDDNGNGGNSGSGGGNDNDDDDDNDNDGNDND